MTMATRYAHTPPEPTRDWHRLDDHLNATSHYAAQFGAPFGADEWARLAGLWHDLGKYSADFQNMLNAAASPDGHLESRVRVDHSTAGAIHAEETLGKLGRILAYVIAGHHAGLPDWSSESGAGALKTRLRNKVLWEAAISTHPPKDIIEGSLPVQRPLAGADPSFWIRMIYSALVDADFLDTEAFYEPARKTQRAAFPQLRTLAPGFDDYMAGILQKVEETPVNKARREIFEECTAKAEGEPGIFTLTVPTGGGKTLASMAFALKHALRHDKRRIIYVIPYTSIIEQTANQFREIFGDAVVEHHSNFDDGERESNKIRLASENWDAPIIVTTSVQFFESLYASRSSRCRKLHNIANSVVVLDETQLLPPTFVNPILFALKQLAACYKTTLVLTTATQPAFEPWQDGPHQFVGIDNTKEIISNPDKLHDQFRRVQIEIPDDLNTPVSWETLADNLADHDSVLCVVNRRDDCKLLHRMMPEGTFHLSALMCGAHRSEVLGQIRRRLREERPTRVISTQLVEAGVDLDFPVVYRALAGLDSIAQAAGRCNREGRLETGLVRVFVPPSKIPAGYLRQAADVTRRLLSERPEDPISPELFSKFFGDLYWLQGENLDAKKILRDLQPNGDLGFAFRSVAERFQIIDESRQVSILVRYGKGGELIEQLTRRGPERWLMRKLQRYTVNIPRYLFESIKGKDDVTEVYPGIFAQAYDQSYDPTTGFCDTDSLDAYRVEDMII